MDRAWINVASTDHFYLYVNGVLVNETNFACARVTGIFDIKHLLTPGKNVVAVYVPRVFYPGSSQLCAKICYGATNSALTEVVSDDSWKASNTPDGIIGSYRWYAPQLEDESWAAARVAYVREKLSTVQPVSVLPEVFEQPPVANWITGPRENLSQATFERHISLPASRGDTWLQIAANGSYDVVINGKLAIVQPNVARTVLPFAVPSDAGPANVASDQITGLHDEALTSSQQVLPLDMSSTISIPTLLAYDISKWLGSGDNRIQICVKTDIGSAALLAETMTKLPNGSFAKVDTDVHWSFVSSQDKVSQQPLVIGSNGIAPWGRLPQAPATPILVPGIDVTNYIVWILVTSAVVASVLMLWLGVSVVSATYSARSLHATLAFDALLHLPALTALLVCWLLTFDIRFNNDWCFRPVIFCAAIVALILPRLLHLARYRGKTTIFQQQQSYRYVKITAFTAVVLLGFAIRAWDLNAMSLGSDEMTMILNANGVLHGGYPHAIKGSFDRNLATYEMIPYSLAISSFFFGPTEFAYHLPSLIFSTLTVALIGWVGLRMFDWRVGLVCSLIYALFPPGIAWARNAFYPSQEQFLSLLTFGCFYQAIKCRPIHRRYLTFASIGILCSYLSWEGSGFILPAFFMAMFALKWGEYDWMTDWHLWRCFLAVAMVIAIQLCYRQLVTVSYFSVGYSLSDITAPSLVYSQSLVYNPTYYIKALFFSEVNFVLSLFIFGGFLFCWNDKRIRYLVVLLFTLEICYTNLLPFYAPRYCYNAETLLILSGVAIFFRLYDYLRALGGNELPILWNRFRSLSAFALAAWFLLATNEWVLRPFRLSADAENPALFGRLGYRKTDHRAAADYVSRRLAAGDGVVAFMPHIFEFYAQKHVDYSINTFLNTKMTYDGGLGHPWFIDKFLGRPLIRSLEELRDIQSRYQRVWFIVPIHDENELMSPDVLDFLQRQGQVVFESYREQVILLQGAQNLLGSK